MANVVEDTTPQLGGNLDANDKAITNATLISAKSISTDYGSSSAPVTFTVTVASKTSGHPYNGDGSSSGYFIDGVESPALTFGGADGVTSSSGYVYKFDQSDASNSGHPLLFYKDAAKTTAYTTNVTTSGTPGSAGAYTQIEVNEDTPPILYYQCSAHGYMGNYANVPTSLDGSSLKNLPPSGGSVTVNASGTVTAGDPCILTSTGTAEKSLQL